jgi:ABC-type transport system substrate-binding protein
LLPIGLKEYQLDPKVIAAYFVEDPAKAKQLLTAANFDLTREFDLMGQQPGSVLEAGALVWQQQLARAGIKTRVNTVAGTGQLFQRWGDNNWELMVQTGNGNDTPSQALRCQHTAGWSDVFRRFALHDPEIDALIEKSEAALDFQENVKLVKEAQMLAIQRYTSFYEILTADITTLLQSRVQNYEITLISTPMRVDVWLKQA